MATKTYMIQLMVQLHVWTDVSEHSVLAVALNTLKNKRRDATRAGANWKYRLVDIINDRDSAD